MNTWKKAAILSLSTLAFFTSCKDDDDDNNKSTGITIPSEYVSADFSTNASAELNMVATLNSLTSAMKVADGGNTVVIEDLKSSWENTALKDETSFNYIQIVNEQLPTLVTASGSGTFDWNTAPSNTGGHFEGRVFGPEGLECVQMVEKGLFGAALYNQARDIVNTLGNDITAEDIDRLVALFGATPAFSNSDNVAENADKLAAKYAARRTPASGGLYLDMKQNFIRAKAYAAAGASYNSQKAMALENLLQDWEKSIAATTINYLYSTIDKLSQTNPDDAAIEDGMHAFSESTGFLAGVVSINSSDRIISDQDGDNILSLMKAPIDDVATAYLFVTDAANELGDLTTAINELQTVYGFSNEEMEGFKKNWVKEEGR